MDSGCEVVIVDVNVATTNGINGGGAHAEEAAEMKTRSKAVGEAVGDDDAAKLKVRLTRTAGAPKSADDKEASDGEKKEKKKSVRSGAGDAEEAKPASKEPAPATVDSAAGAKAATGGAVSASVAPAKKKALERDDDSGINSRASSVSNDDVGTPARMRTRSSRATTSGRVGAAARVPISIYEFDAASFDDDLPLAASTSKGATSAQKRKAVYVEEMEDDEEREGGAVEPVAKRRAAFLLEAGAGIVTSLMYPLRKLRSGIAAVRPFRAAPSAVEQGEEENEAVDEAADTSSSEDVAQCNDQPQREGAANYCSLM